VHLEALATAGAGYLHRAWGEAELAFALRVNESEWELRRALAGIYRALRGCGGEASGRELVAVLAGKGPHPRTPEVVGRCVRVMEELDLVAWEGPFPDGEMGGERTLRVVSSEGTELNRSTAYIAYLARHEEGARFLSSRQRPRVG
jgi:hypothetical protein